MDIPENQGRHSIGLHSLEPVKPLEVSKADDGKDDKTKGQEGTKGHKIEPVFLISKQKDYAHQQHVASDGRIGKNGIDNPRAPLGLCNFLLADRIFPQLLDLEIRTDPMGTINPDDQEEHGTENAATLFRYADVKQIGEHAIAQHTDYNTPPQGDLPEK